MQTRLDRFVATQDPAVLLAQAAVGEVEDLLKTVPDPAADLEIMTTAGFLHWFRYQVLPAGEDQEDLLAALKFFQPVCKVQPDVVPEPLLAHLDPARAAAARAKELLRRTETAADPAALDEAVDLLQQVVAATPKDHPMLPGYLGDLDDALERRFALRGERADIDAAVDVSRRAVAAIPAGHPDRASALSNLGNALGLRFERYGDRADLDQAIEAGSAAAAEGTDHPANAQILANLGGNLMLRADLDGVEADVRAAVGHLRQATELLPPDHPARPPVAATLANALLARWELRDDPGDLSESIRLCEEALTAVPPGHPMRDGILLTLSKALHNRGVDLLTTYRDSADLSVLNAAIEALTRAAAGLPAEHPIRLFVSSALCTALTSRYERTGDPADLERAVTEGEQACADPEVRTAHALSNLSNALRRRYERDGQFADLDRAIDAGRQAVALTEDTGPELASTLSNLGGVLQRRFERTGEIVILNEAIEIFQQAVAADRNPVFLGNLGIGLLTRFERDGAEADLRNAIEIDREALRATPGGHPDRARRLVSLSNALIASAAHGGGSEDLDEGIRLARDASAALPADHADRARYRITLGNALLKRWERTALPGDLDEGIELLREAVDALPSASPQLPRLQTKLGDALLARADRDNRASDLDEAIDRYRHAATAGDGSLQAVAWANVAHGMTARYDRTGAAADFEEAVAAQQNATDAATTTGLGGGSPDGGPDPGEGRPPYHRYTRAMLKTRMEMWRQTGNPEWLTEDLAHLEALALLRKGATHGPDNEAIRAGLDFLALRSTALEGSARARAVDELRHLPHTLRDHGVQVEARPPGPAFEPTRRTPPSLLPDLDRIMDFWSQTRATPTPGALGELVLSRLDEYDESFFTGMAAVAYRSRVMGDGDLAESVDGLAVYLRWALDVVRQHGADRFRDDLAWGQTLEDLERLAAHPNQRATADRKVARLRELIDGLPDGDRQRASRRSQLATALLQRFKRTGQLSDLDDVIAEQRSAVADTAAGSRDRSDMLANLALLHKTRHEHGTGEPDAALPDLDMAIDVGRQSLRITPIDHESIATRLGAHATLLLQRHDLTGQSGDADEAADCLQQALDCGRADRHQAASLAALLHVARHRAVPTTGDHQPASPDPRTVLRERLAPAMSNGDTNTLGGDNACDEVLAALAAVGSPPDPGLDVQALVDTVNFLRLRIDTVPETQSHAEMEISKDISDWLNQLKGTAPADSRRPLTEVVEEALTRLCDLWGRPRPAPPPFDPDAAWRGLAKVLGPSWERMDLDAQIGLLRDLLDNTPWYSPYAGLAHDALAVLMWERAKRDGSVRDLREVIEHFLTAISLVDSRDPHRAQHVAGLKHKLGTALLTLGERRQDAEALDFAITMMRQALEPFRPGDPERSLCLSNLGMALQERHVVTGAEQDVQEAIRVLREAVRDTDVLHADRPARLTNLCRSLRSSYELTHDPQELGEAIDVGCEALAGLPVGDVHRARLLANLGECFEIRYGKTRASGARDQAMVYFAEAARADQSPIWDRIRPARGWGRLARDAGDWAGAADAFECAVELLPLLAWHGLGLGERLSYLGATNLTGLASEAAASAIRIGQPERALAVLEHGRGVLLGHLLNLRTEFADLVERHPDVAYELDSVRSGLDSRLEADPESRRNLARRWDQLVARVRGLPGFAGFLHPPSIEALLPAAREGTVVVVNPATNRSDALLLTSTGVRPCELPDLRQDDVIGYADRYLEALRAVERAAEDSRAARLAARHSDDRETFRRYRTAQLELNRVQRQADDNLRDTLAWLWDTIAEPVLDALGIHSPPAPGQPWPRVWWSPVGPLSLLPLHAAGRHDAAAHTSVLDRAIPSYAPTVRALRQTWQAQATEADARMLVVALPDTPGQPPLPQVATERDLLVAAFPGDRHTLLEAEAATRESVARQLPLHQWVHLSCHGDQDLDQPIEGGLWVHDGMLTFADLITLQSHGDFAFLSACKTATSGGKLADEVITVAAALHYTGYRHVIASTWSVSPQTAAELATDVYRELTESGAFTADRAAVALHEAIRARRDAAPSRPTEWAWFTHTGP